MKIDRIQYTLEGDRLAVYLDELLIPTAHGVERAGFTAERTPVLILQVRDDVHAAELVAAIEKSDRTPPKARKQRKTKSPVPSTNGLPAGGPQPSGAGENGSARPAGSGATPASVKAAASGEVPPKCAVPDGCTFDADIGSAFCRDHAKADGKKRARAIGETIQVAP